MKNPTPNSELRTSHSEAPDPERAKLLAMFERLNLPVTMFDSLRSDAYEKDVAKQSVGQLERVYLTLFNPGEACTEIQEQLPRWTDGKHAGRLPSINTLMKIKHRIMAQYVADDLGEHVEQMNSLLNRLSGLPADLRKDVYDLMMTVLGAELFKAKFNGKKLMEHMPVVKCIMKDKEMKMRERESAERLELQKTSKELQKSRLELEQKKLAQRQQEAATDATPRRRRREETPSIHQATQGASATPPNEPAQEEEDSGLTEDEKTDRLLERAYGKPPADLDFGPYVAHLQDKEPPKKAAAGQNN
jgi:hypothetical protein